jgi:broad specificity phosphatase PhoE
MAADSINAADRSARKAKRRRPRCGAIILTRHGEPGISRKVKLSSAEYVAWWARYEETGLLEGQSPPIGLLKRAAAAGHIFASTRVRAIETAKAVSGERQFQIEVELIEAPLPPPAWPGFIRFSPRTWGVIARLWWWLFDHHEDDQESRAEAESRADSMAERLAALAQETGDDVLVLAHGFFNTMIGQALKRRGWRLVEDQGFHYWRSRRFERRRV